MTAESFPEDHCRTVFSEINVWTSVEDCLAAARFLESRLLPTDQLDNTLIVPFPDDDIFEGILIECLRFLIASYRPPEIKIRVASLIDGAILPGTQSVLVERRFAPDVSVGPAGVIGPFATGLAERTVERFLQIRDEPEVIELVQNPVRCVVDMIHRAWPTAQQLRSTKAQARKTGGTPTIFHQPYSDGPLFALVDALTFYASGHDLGPMWSHQVRGINRGYRSFEIVDRPPIDQRLLDVARSSCEAMFRDLA